mmetsp:Transcript_80377/g.236489  ORF Transcript_80377/g.236489 Transcript_80377/m.236489 type:complete len:213 (+) Transcript_80377:1028-1666(+)
MDSNLNPRLGLLLILAVLGDRLAQVCQMPRPHRQAVAPDHGPVPVLLVPHEPPQRREAVHAVVELARAVDVVVPVDGRRRAGHGGRGPLRRLRGVGRDAGLGAAAGLRRLQAVEERGDLEDRARVRGVEVQVEGAAQEVAEGQALATKVAGRRGHGLVAPRAQGRHRREVEGPHLEAPAVDFAGQDLAAAIQLAPRLLVVPLPEAELVLKPA